MSDKKPKALWWCKDMHSMEKPPSECTWNGAGKCCYTSTYHYGPNKPPCTAIKYTPERKEK